MVRRTCAAGEQGIGTVLYLVHANFSSPDVDAAKSRTGRPPARVKFLADLMQTAGGILDPPPRGPSSKVRTNSVMRPRNSPRNSRLQGDKLSGAPATGGDDNRGR